MELEVVHSLNIPKPALKMKALQAYLKYMNCIALETEYKTKIFCSELIINILYYF